MSVRFWPKAHATSQLAVLYSLDMPKRMEGVSQGKEAGLNEIVASLGKLLSNLSPEEIQRVSAVLDVVVDGAYRSSQVRHGATSGSSREIDRGARRPQRRYRGAREEAAMAARSAERQRQIEEQRREAQNRWLGPIQELEEGFSKPDFQENLSPEFLAQNLTQWLRFDGQKGIGKAS